MNITKRYPNIKSVKTEKIICYSCEREIQDGNLKFCDKGYCEEISFKYKGIPIGINIFNRGKIIIEIHRYIGEPVNSVQKVNVEPKLEIDMDDLIQDNLSGDDHGS